MDVDIFIPCLVDQFSPQTGMNMVKVMKKAGVTVHYNNKQTCCGQTAFNNGYWDEAKKIGEKFIVDFNTENIVVGPSTSCVNFVRNHYDKLFYNSGLHLEFKRLKKRIFEFSDFMVNIVKHVDVGAELNARAVYLDSCSSAQSYGLKNEPRELLNKVKGLELIELENEDECCSFGGLFSLTTEPVALVLAKRVVLAAIESGAQVIISTDFSCLLNLDSYIQKNSISMKVMHIADVLAQGY